MTELVIISELNQNSSAFEGMIPVIVGGFIALLGTLLAQYLQFIFVKKGKILEDRNKLYSELKGLKLLRHQLVYYYGEATIYSNYFEHLHKLKNDKFLFEEAFRWMKKAEDFGLDVTKTNQTLLEKLGLVSILFSEVSGIHSSIEKISFKGISFAMPPDESGLEDLERYKIEACHGLDKLIKDNYSDKLESLLDLMKVALTKKRNLL